MEQIRQRPPRAATVSPAREVRPQSATVDIHAHVGVPEAAKFVEPYLDWATIPLAHFANAETKALNQKQEADIRATASDRRAGSPISTPWASTCR